MFNPFFLVLIVLALPAIVLVIRRYRSRERLWQRVFVEVTIDGVPFYGKPNRFGPFRNIREAYVWEKGLRSHLKAMDLLEQAVFTHCYAASRVCTPEVALCDIESATRTFRALTGTSPYVPDHLN
jgi:hypothetical protein